MMTASSRSNKPTAAPNSHDGELHRPQYDVHSVERIPTVVYRSHESANLAVASELAELIRKKQKADENAVLGLATGSTPTGIYEQLVRMHRDEGLSFANVITFNLDEYWPMKPDDLQSYVRFMREYLFDHVDMDPANIHLPDGTIPLDRIAEYGREYEQSIQEAGGIDVQILGIGRTGHIGFNEPGSSRESRTRLITLDRITRADAASDFFGEWNVPRKAITMGVGSILNARRVILIAFGEHKALVIKRAVEEPMTPVVAASFLQQHANARIVLDHASAAQLTRIKCPWRLGPIGDFGLAWDEATTRKAAIWLAQTVEKPITKLTDEDYNEHGLQELLSARGDAYDINIEVFKSRQRTITGWPGGKPGRLKADGSIDEFPKRVVVFSPHPDDDVISMGGTLIRLCDQGHEVHVAYQTSGNIAVFDDEALWHMDFVVEFCNAFAMVEERNVERIEDAIERFIRGKGPGEVDTPELKLIKTTIRRTEARSAAKYSGVKEENIHFLDMPFYETGRVKKKPLSEEDVRIVVNLLEENRPNQIYAAGDFSDPHGTHRVCMNAITAAINRLADREWLKECEIFLYRGAWQEWEPEVIDMAVPLSPLEVERKRLAIFKHESQKDKALFPGPVDAREFWQRAEERNRNTARIYDQLGLAEYEAIEGFVRWKLETNK